MTTTPTPTSTTIITQALKLKHQIIGNIHINKELRELDCYDCNLDKLPDKLPEKLRILNCYNNKLTEIKNIPKNLKILRCFHNHLTTLTFPKKSAIFAINCSHNAIIDIGELPGKLKDLICFMNNITTLPTLPDTLIHLNCSYNCIIELPKLPTTLEILRCRNNQIYVLPDVLPNDLYRLECCANNLTYLPDLSSNKNLIYLQCGENQLTKLPDLPDTLIYISCDNNQITALPEVLPSALQILQCYNNLLSELPDLPESLKYIYSDNNTAAFHKKYPKLIEMQQYLSFPNNFIEAPPISDVINYVNGINSQERIRARLYKLHSKGNPFLEPYMRRMMHPDRLKTLCDDESIDVDEYMTRYVESL